MATKVVVSLPGENDYAVRIGSGVIDALGRDLRNIDRVALMREALVITDSNVGSLYLSQVRKSLSQAGFKVSDLTVPAGEASKSLEIAGEVWQAMAQLALGRDSLVVALGGGVVGDLAGFIASTYMRGIALVQVPTSLLAMVDSSVGGKTAVNLPEGKNLVGTFYQPTFVCADISVLQTLPEREWLCGCGEIAKSAVIDSDDFFFWLMENAGALANRSDEGIIAEAIARCVVFKADVVARDKTETAGIRECLNFGHTLGHAVEACAGYGVLSHGVCVAEGMRFAAQVTVDEMAQVDEEAAMGAREFAQAQAELLDMLGLARLDLAAMPGVSPEALLAAMKRDKKARGGELRFVLANDVAKWRVVGLGDETVLAHLRSWIM